MSEGKRLKYFIENEAGPQAKYIVGEHVTIKEGALLYLHTISEDDDYNPLNLTDAEIQDTAGDWMITYSECGWVLGFYIFGYLVKRVSDGAERIVFEGDIKGVTL